MEHQENTYPSRENAVMAEDAPTAPPAPAAPPTPAPATPPPAVEDKGFPENTPVAEMTAVQQAAYYKTQARKHEDRVKALGVTPESLAELRAKAERADNLEYDLSSATDKAVLDAKTAAANEARSQFLPQLVEAKLEAAAAGRIEPDRLASLIGPLDKNYFLTADGKVDADKVSAYIDGIAPAKGTDPQPKGPSATGTGRRGTTTTTGANVASGRDLWAQMHPKKAS